MSFWPRRRRILVIVASLAACDPGPPPDSAADTDTDEPIDTLYPEITHPCDAPGGPVLLWSQPATGRPSDATPRLGLRAAGDVPSSFVDDVVVPPSDGCWCVTSVFTYGNLDPDSAGAEFYGDLRVEETRGDREEGANSSFIGGHSDTTDALGNPRIPNDTSDKLALWPGVNHLRWSYRDTSPWLGALHAAPAAAPDTDEVSYADPSGLWSSGCADDTPWSACTTAESPAHDVAFELWGVIGGERCDTDFGYWNEPFDEPY